MAQFITFDMVKNNIIPATENSTGVRPGANLVAKNKLNGFGDLSNGQVTDRYLYDSVQRTSPIAPGDVLRFFNNSNEWPLSNVGRNLEVGESIAVQYIQFLFGNAVGNITDLQGFPNDGFVSMRVGNTKILDRLSLKSNLGWSVNAASQFTLQLSKAIIIPPQTDFEVEILCGGGNGSTEDPANYQFTCVLIGTGALLRLNQL